MDGSFALKLAAISLFFLAFPQASESLSVGAEIGRSVNGSISWINMTESPVQIIDFYWMNTGSSTCMVRARMDFFDHDDNMVYSAWSRENPMISGSEGKFGIIASLPAGIYRAFLRVYQCNEIIGNGPYIFEITPPEPDEDIEITGVRTYSDSIEISLNSKYQGNVYVIPENYPLGWIVESGTILDGRTEIGYDPGVWIERNVTFLAVSEDGMHTARRTFALKREIKGLDTLIFLTVFGVAVFFVMMVLSRRYNC
ncbi:MAG: hypothetical protein JW754_01395 [Candidatus Aenigmarchaeota archaeon]|nr:hypothetical protein [Candidatus Aenigmarchaeota archaeon]